MTNGNGGGCFSGSRDSSPTNLVAPYLMAIYQIKLNQFISETADSKIEIQDNDNVHPLTEVR